MYLKEKLIIALKIKNWIFTFIGVFEIALSAANLISLAVYYIDDLETFLHAKSTPESITSLIIGTVLLVSAVISKYRIGDAGFYSSYFEGDLDGYVKYSDLAEVTGRSEAKVKRQLGSFRRFYMKGYELKTADNLEQVVLNSKKCLCECRSCGAEIEKRVYFTGVCPYCSSSDLFAKILTGNRFYSIGNNVSEGIKKPEFYKSKYLKMKKAFHLSSAILGALVILILSIISFENISHYNDREYLTELLLSGKSYSSFELIKKELITDIIWDSAFVLALIPVVLFAFRKISYIITAEKCSGFFARCKTPFIEAGDFPYLNGSHGRQEKMKSVRGAVRRRYLCNCTFEKHDNVLKIALAKKIVKDTCPSCGAPVTGAVDENYKCSYCGNMIMGVISKK